MKIHQPATLFGHLAACPTDATVDLPPPSPPKRHGQTPMCDLCAKTFARQKALKRHQQTLHRQSDGFSCRVCDQHLYRKDSLRKHHIRKHADGEYDAPASYPCPICQKSCHYRGHFREHLKTHPASTTSLPPTCISCQPIGATGLHFPHRCTNVSGRWGGSRTRGLLAVVCWELVSDPLASEGWKVHPSDSRRLEAASDIGDMLRAIFHSRKNSFKINLSFGFILSNVETGEKRYYYPSQNGLVFD